MGCPEVKDWETEGSTDVRMRARVCGRAGQEAVNLPHNYSSQKANGREGEWRGGGSTGQKREELNKERIKPDKSPPYCPVFPARRGGRKPPAPKCGKGVEGLPASVPWVTLSLSLNAMLIHLPVRLSHAATKLFNPRPKPSWLRPKG